MEGGTLECLDDSDLAERLKQLTHAQLEALVESECANRDFAGFFEALAPVQRARAAEEKLVGACATLARATIQRATLLGPTLSAAAEANARVVVAAAALDERHAALQHAWAQSASGDAVAERLRAGIADARARAAAVVQHGEQWAEDERAIDAYVQAARERHRLELMLDALPALQAAGPRPARQRA